MNRRTAAVLISIFCAATAFAEDKHHHGTDASARGEVRKVDKDAKKITIKHGPLEHLDMPAMTMVYLVKDPAMLDQVKAGDKVNFQAEKIGGALTVIQLAPIR